MAGHIRRLDSGKWQARFPKPGGGRGKFTTQSFGRKIEADRWLRDQNRKRDAGEWLDPNAGKMLFSEMAKVWTDSRLDRAAATRARDDALLRNHVLPALGDLQLNEVSTEVLVGWIVGMKGSDLAPATVAKCHQIAGSILAMAVDFDRIARNPSRSKAVRDAVPSATRAKSEMVVLSVSEVTRLADAIDPRYRPLVLTAFYTGMRWGELVGLKAKYVNLDKGRITVAEALEDVNGVLAFKEPKSEESARTITIDARTVAILREHLNQFPAVADGLVFRGPEGGALRRTAFRSRVWRPAIRAANLSESATFHSLRHSHAALLISMNFHPKVIQARLGHANIRITLDIYGHLMPGLDQEVADRLAGMHADPVKHEGSIEAVGTVTALES